MKTSLLILSFFLVFGLLHGQEKTKEGVLFFQGNWQTLLQQAQKENKPIFVDVYTDWCPPCKQMDQEVFPLATIGTTYNTSFINYKLNAEKGEGPALAKQFNVHAYPTYLYLDPQGNLLQRVVDFQEPTQFIAIAQEALDKHK